MKIDSGDTAWLLVSAAFVLLMTPGLALFYGGMVRAKNVLSTFMHSFFAMGLVTLQWVTFGYSLAFGNDHGGLIGGFNYAFLNGVGMDPRPGQTVPHLLFMVFQLMFAIITPALISGAFAERLKFSAYVLFTLGWTTLVYDPVAHWVWGEGGWLLGRGALDFAGGTVVHVTSGVSALVFALMLGKRMGYPREKHSPHSLTMTVLGAGLLWFGWFGFNAGSALAANGLSVLALVNTHIAAAAGALAWAGTEWIRLGKPSALGFASGLVAGLVVITPAAGFVGPVSSLVMGLAAGLICYAAVLAKGRFGYDDTLDAFGVHGVGGAAGAILTGVFAAKAWNSAGADGIIHGNFGLFGEQILATLVAAGYAAGVTFVLVKVVDKLVGLRVDQEVEWEGLDLNLHGEQGYSLGNVAGHAVVPEHGSRHEEAAEVGATKGTTPATAERVGELEAAAASAHFVGT